MARVLSVCLAAVLLLAALSATAAGPDGPYVQARVEFKSASEAERFMGIEGLDIMKSKPGVGVQLVTSFEQIEELRALGFDVIVEHDDMASFYASRNTVRGYGDFLTFDETVAFINALHASYPNIVSEPISIATTEEGRTLWALKISDNPEVDELEPEILLDAVHHAREPIGINAVTNYMTWLTSNYGTDAEATFLVDNREIWFIPCVNPDGYCYNESTDPDGGGMWRKNRRDNAGSSCYGVDPNRNYGYQWGTSGISTDPCNEVYCGTEAFSEPEIAGYRDFVEAHDFTTNITFHSVAAAVLVPWSYTSAFYPPEPDNTMFHEIGDVMAMYSGYEVGTADEVINYTCSGTTCDWMYGVHGIWSLCIEVGGSGFWPQQSEIAGLTAENLWPQQYISRIAGAYLALDSTHLAGGNGDQEPDAGETLNMTVTVDNQGVVANAANVRVTLLTDDPYVDLLDAETMLGTIGAGSAGQNALDPFSFSVDAGTPDGHGLIMTLVIEGDGLYMEEELSWMVGEPTVVFFDDMESGTGNWVENDGYWGLTTASSHSPSNSYTDSPGGSYSNYRNTWIELATPIDFSAAAAADLSFWHRVVTEEDYDFCYVEASDDNGATWSQVGPKYHGNSYGFQQIELSLNDFVGTSGFKLRFRFTSDSYVTDDGWYVDDVTISGPPTGNTKPTVPILNDPPDGGTVAVSTPVLTVDNSSDVDPGDVLTYGFRVYDDAVCTNLVASMSGVAEGSATTSWTVGSSLADGTYYWRTFADDGTERSQLMATCSFLVESTGVGETFGRVALYPASPNPFGGTAKLSFALPARTNVELSVYSVDGRLVRTLVSGEAGPGQVDVTWDGRDNSGRNVGNGLYFMRLQAAGETRHGKLVVLR